MAANRGLSHSMGALRWLYTVAAGFAVIQAVRTFAQDTQGRVDFRFNGDFVLLLVFMSVVIRFTHGAIRHFHKWYDEATEGWTPLQPLSDFFGLFLEAFFFLLMALALQDHPQFAVYYFLLLLTDTLWLTRVPVGPQNYRNWLVANSLFFLFTVPFFVWNREQDAVLLPTLGVMTLIHHVLDYSSPGNWHYYFEGVPKPRLFTWVEQDYGVWFLKMGNFMWAIMTSIWRLIPRGIRDSLSRAIEPTEETPPSQLRGVIYVAGKYHGTSRQEIDANIQAAEQAAVQLWNAGFGAFTPHLNTAHFEEKAAASDDAYKEFDLRILACVDAVVALPGWDQSSGAQAEIEQAKRLDKPIFHCVDDLVASRP